MRQMKMSVIVMVVLGVVGLGLGAQTIYSRTFVAKNLENALLDLPGVTDVNFNGKAGHDGEVAIRLASNTRLDEVYPEIQREVRRHHRSDAVAIVLLDHPGDTLPEVSHYLHFALREAVVTGRFTLLPLAVNEVSARWPSVAVNIVVGDAYVFVSLHDGDAYSFEAIPIVR